MKTHGKLLDAPVELRRARLLRASVREIAQAPKPAMSSITYPFGGKEGRYLAAADHIAVNIRERQADALAELLAGARPSRTQRAAGGGWDALAQD